MLRSSELSVVAFSCLSTGFGCGLFFTGAVSLIVWGILFAAYIAAIAAHVGLTRKDLNMQVQKLDGMSAAWDRKHKELLIERALFEQRYMPNHLGEETRIQ
jgi:hypothetical protein